MSRVWRTIFKVIGSIAAASAMLAAGYYWVGPLVGQYPMSELEPPRPDRPIDEPMASTPTEDKGKPEPDQPVSESDNVSVEVELTGSRTKRRRYARFETIIPGRASTEPDTTATPVDQPADPPVDQPTGDNY